MLLGVSGHGSTSGRRDDLPAGVSVRARVAGQAGGQQFGSRCGFVDAGCIFGSASGVAGQDRGTQAWTTSLFPRTATGELSDFLVYRKIIEENLCRVGKVRNSGLKEFNCSSERMSD